MTKETVISAIKRAAEELGRPPSRSEFIAKSGITEYRMLEHFASWREAVASAGLQANFTNVRLDNAALLEDWGKVVRKLGHIPTRTTYRKQGEFSPGSFENRFGPWSGMPKHFAEFAAQKQKWVDVLALLPAPSSRRATPQTPVTSKPSPTGFLNHQKLDTSPVFGDPIDFRGLRHEPVNESGVVFLFGMVARELGYLVEALHAAYPDCEAKRQVASGKWQRVRVEFEFASRNFRDHGHARDKCDVIVCWIHNWPDCPIEVLELSAKIKELPTAAD